ncbi:MAG: hypothetical protein EPO68_04665 [Planctomycetota bacterium]|nr:MAG: hypothetical protein EPO68_04665 [Planctomycetota bacterium]
MSWHAVALLCLAQQAPQWPRDEWMAAAALPAGVERERALCEISYRARDFAGAAVAARIALQHAPRDLRLLQLQCGSSLWLADAGGAADALLRWRAALESDTELAADARAWWEERVKEQSAQVDELHAADAARARCAQRARWTALAWGLAIGACAVWLTSTKTAPIAARGGDRG